MISLNICTRKMCKYVNSFVQRCRKLGKKAEKTVKPRGEGGREVRNGAALKNNRTIYVFRTTRKALFLHTVPYGGLGVSYS